MNSSGLVCALWSELCRVRNKNDVFYSLPAHDFSPLYRLVLGSFFWKDGVINIRALQPLKHQPFFLSISQIRSNLRDTNLEVFFNTIQHRRSQHARTLTSMNTRTKILPLWAPPKDWTGRSGDSRSHHWRLVVDGNTAYHLTHNAEKSWNKSRKIRVSVPSRKLRFHHNGPNQLIYDQFAKSWSCVTWTIIFF